MDLATENPIDQIVRQHDGVNFYDLTQTQAIQFLSPLTDSPIPIQWVTLTVGMYLEAQRDPEFLRIINSSISIPESTGLRLYSRLRHPLMPRVPGGDTIRVLVNELVKHEKPLVLIGTTEANRNQAKLVLENEVPGLEIIAIKGVHNFDDPEESRALAEMIHGIQPGLTLVAVDEIRGPKWVNRHLIEPKLSCGLVVCGGQTTDVWAGAKRTPPEWARKHGMGWFIRLFLENKERRSRYTEVLKEFLVLTTSQILTKNYKLPNEEFGWGD